LTIGASAERRVVAATTATIAGRRAASLHHVAVHATAAGVTQLHVATLHSVAVAAGTAFGSANMTGSLVTTSFSLEPAFAVGRAVVVRALTVFVMK
jgi:hypothetical protein